MKTILILLLITSNAMADTDLLVHENCHNEQVLVKHKDGTFSLGSEEICTSSFNDTVEQQ